MMKLSILILQALFLCYAETFAFSVVPELAKYDGGKSAKIKAERKPWDAVRFVKQSLQFVSLPRVIRPNNDVKIIRPGDILWQPSSSSNIFKWGPLDDVVMGGVSSSNIDNGTGLWTGTVSDANSGGFVGIRTTPLTFKALDMSSCAGVEFRLKGGNAKRFKAIVRDSTEFNGVCWTTSFDSPQQGNAFLNLFEKKGTSQLGTIQIEFNKQIPTIFARTVPKETFVPENVVGLQLVYSKFEYDGDLNPNFELGNFSLQILEVRAY